MSHTIQDPFIYEWQYQKGYSTNKAPVNNEQRLELVDKQTAADLLEALEEAQNTIINLLEYNTIGLRSTILANATQLQISQAIEAANK